MNRPTNPGPLPERGEAKELYQLLHPALEQQLQGIQETLRKLFEEQGYTPTIKYRVKGFETYFNKLAKLARAGDPLVISDLLGVRVICPFLEDLDNVEQLINSHFDVVELERKGDRHSFREFGYDSVHMLVRFAPQPGPYLPFVEPCCEIQLRTILQDAWAEVEHELVYKSDIALPNDSIRRKLASLNASLTLSDLIFQEIRDFQKEVRVRGIKRRQSVEDFLGGSSAIEIHQQLTTQEDPTDIKAFEHAAQNTPRSLEKLMLNALEAHSNRSFQIAIALYGRILRMKLEPPLRSLVYNHRGMALFALAEYLRAIEDFSRAIHHNRLNTRAWCNRGLVYRVQGKFDLSLEDYDKAIDQSPEQFEGFWGRAQTCFEMKLYSRAITDCQKVIYLQGDFTPARELEKTIRRMIF